MKASCKDHIDRWFAKHLRMHCVAPYSQSVVIYSGQGGIMYFTIYTGIDLHTGVYFINSTFYIVILMFELLYEQLCNESTKRQSSVFSSGKRLLTAEHC